MSSFTLASAFVTDLCRVAFHSFKDNNVVFPLQLLLLLLLLLYNGASIRSDPAVSNSELLERSELERTENK